MEIRLVEGCICDSFTIDGKEVSAMSGKEIKDALLNIIDVVPEDQAYWILREVVETAGEYEDLGHCEQCGDYIEAYTLTKE